jgi:hypothetical protein
MFNIQDSVLVFHGLSNYEMFMESLETNIPINIFGQSFMVTRIERQMYYSQVTLEVTLRQVVTSKTTKQLMEEEIAAILDKYKGKV